ncbi:hypothetical protein FB45DRAFT_934170 [Roridomyces roridus]|uniref:Uncharacterized protein n=1 Tax=Roridomyces roridus TaxID=1738132 RepID=A0AAD7BC78_9AGAR|nr:hypothetical protein FB45DRAFT_934170 [Roridomyces roridus]
MLFGWEFGHCGAPGASLSLAQRRAHSAFTYLCTGPLRGDCLPRIRYGAISNTYRRACEAFQPDRDHRRCLTLYSARSISPRITADQSGPSTILTILSLPCAAQCVSRLSDPRCRCPSESVSRLSTPRPSTPRSRSCGTNASTSAVLQTAVVRSSGLSVFSFALVFHLMGMFLHTGGYARCCLGDCRRPNLTVRGTLVVAGVLRCGSVA